MNRTTQRMLCLLLAVLLCCSLLTACADQPAPQSQDSTAAPAPDTTAAQSQTPADTQSQTPADTQSESAADTEAAAPEQPAGDTPITIDNIRSLVIGIDEPVTLRDGSQRPMINFDNAATTPALQPVADAVSEELKLYGSIGRGFSQKSNHSTDIYNGTRDKVLDFVGADPDVYTCFYVNNTTDGLNKLAS